MPLRTGNYRTAEGQHVHVNRTDAGYIITYPSRDGQPGKTVTIAEVAR